MKTTRTTRTTRKSRPPSLSNLDASDQRSSHSPPVANVPFTSAQYRSPTESEFSVTTSLQPSRSQLAPSTVTTIRPPIPMEIPGAEYGLSSMMIASTSPQINPYLFTVYDQPRGAEMVNHLESDNSKRQPNEYLVYPEHMNSTKSAPLWTTILTPTQDDILELNTQGVKFVPSDWITRCVKADRILDVPDKVLWLDDHQNNGAGTRAEYDGDEEDLKPLKTGSKTHPKYLKLTAQLRPRYNEFLQATIDYYAEPGEGKKTKKRFYEWLKQIKHPLATGAKETGESFRDMLEKESPLFRDCARPATRKSQQEKKRKRDESSDLLPDQRSACAPPSSENVQRTPTAVPRSVRPSTAGIPATGLTSVAEETTHRHLTPPVWCPIDISPQESEGTSSHRDHEIGNSASSIHDVSSQIPVFIGAEDSNSPSGGCGHPQSAIGDEHKFSGMIEPQWTSKAKGDDTM
ncbi:hypothetical protein IAU59_007615 [Kwoniella sp. CBS 9459]